MLDRGAPPQAPQAAITHNQARRAVDGTEEGMCQQHSWSQGDKHTIKQQKQKTKGPRPLKLAFPHSAEPQTRTQPEMNERQEAPATTTGGRC